MDQPTDTKRTQLLIPVYALDTESLAFFKFATGIHDDNELKEHVLNVQAQAYTVVPYYPCIHFHSTSQAWQDIQSARFKGVLNLDQEREGALFRILDVALETTHAKL